MKLTLNKLRISVLLGAVVAITLSCTWEPSDDFRPATFPATAEVFIDGFSGGLEYLPFEGSKLDAFTVDTEEFYAGTASMRFDVPNVGDPDGAFAGAIFPDYGGRDLSGFDALTFWARASKAATINEIGFGNDFGENKYNTIINGLRVTTAWKKYTIPIPDPSKLTREDGVFWYSEGPEGGDGYSFWVDEVKYEKLGTVAQPRPAIQNGEDVEVQTFIGSNVSVAGLTQTFNLVDGTNQTVTTTAAFYTFTSSDPSVATVNELGVVNIIGTGSTVITAELAGVKAAGSLTIESLGAFTAAPLPNVDANNVISIFSDAYTDVAIDYYNGFFTDGFQTTLGGNNLLINGDRIINYTELNFVALKTLNTVNASEMTTYHVDILVQEPEIKPDDFIRILLLDAGPDGELGTGDETESSFTIPSSDLASNEWRSFDIPLSSFPGLNTSNLSLFFFISDGTNTSNPGSITNILVDNIYLYR